jgi:uncharacterized secreted protein with C-terminal beta-propeller domain
MKKNKREKLLLSMNLIDEEYIEEANSKKTKQPFPWRRFAAIAACVAVVLVGVGAFWLMSPDSDPIPPHLKPYQDSEYFSIIQKLDAYYTAREQLSTNGMITQAATADRFLDKVPDGSTGSLVDYGRYEETTDNQVNGVIEGDLIKRSDKYIYYLNGKILNIYSIEGEDSKKVGSCTLADWNIITGQVEMYLSEDCKTVTLIAPGVTRDANSYYARYYTQVVSLDVSDPSNIVEKGSVKLNCCFNTSRKVDGTILLLGTYSFYEKPDYSDPATFVPQIDTKAGTVSVPMDSIVVPKELNATQYTVICKLDENTLELMGSGAFLSYTNGVYVSKENVFAAHSYTDSVTESKITTNTTMTEIAAISYNGDSLKPVGSVSVAGSVKDQYSMDEYNGILRVATTTRISTSETYTVDGEEMVKFTPAKTNASLYCIDLSKWTVVAKVKDFAPEGESVQSVRFDGNAAYVCTAEVITISDPVFFFDLSDLDHITYTDTGTIQGYSTSLISFGDGYLVGIGVGDTRDSVKLEVYRESEDGVVSVCSYQVDHAWYITDYKSYLIDRENQLIGLGIYEMNYEPDITNYFLFSYHEGNLTPVIKTRIKDNIYNLESIRAVYIDGYLYVLSGEQFEVVPVDLTETAQ